MIRPSQGEYNISSILKFTLLICNLRSNTHLLYVEKRCLIELFAKETKFANNSFVHLFVTLVEFPKIEALCRLPAGSIVSVYLGTIDYSARCAGSFPKLTFPFPVK